MASPGWTSPAELVAQVERLWDRGALLRAAVQSDPLFPMALRLRGPTSRDLGSRYEEARSWIRALEEGSSVHGYAIEFEEIAHRQLGRNRVPKRVLVQTEAVALRMIGKVRAAERFHALRNVIVKTFPTLEQWTSERPTKVLEFADQWDRLLAVLVWFRDHPRAGLYRRQLEIEHVDTKFIEGHRSLLGELLELTLSPESIKVEPGASFDRRFGLREKPFLVRFRLLDRSQWIQGLSDLTVPIEDLARLDLPVDDIVITENEVNGLALRARPRTLVVFGQGYALERLGEVAWLARRRLFYWGDIDTHGFAILDRFRAQFPAAESLMMDRATLLVHRRLWVEEPGPSTEPLSRLTPEEITLLEELRRGVHGQRVRLEQERIGFQWVRHAVDALRSS